MNAAAAPRTPLRINSAPVNGEGAASGTGTRDECLGGASSQGDWSRAPNDEVTWGLFLIVTARGAWNGGHGHQRDL